MKEALQENHTSEVPIDFTIKLLELVLKYNVFEFDDELYHDGWLVRLTKKCNVLPEPQYPPEPPSLLSESKILRW